VAKPCDRRSQAGPLDAVTALTAAQPDWHPQRCRL